MSGTANNKSIQCQHSFKRLRQDVQPLAATQFFFLLFFVSIHWSWIYIRLVLSFFPSSYLEGKTKSPTFKLSKMRLQIIGHKKNNFATILLSICSWDWFNIRTRIYLLSISLQGVFSSLKTNQNSLGKTTRWGNCRCTGYHVAVGSNIGKKQQEETP